MSACALDHGAPPGASARLRALDLAPPRPLPVARPLLPDADALLPYLRRIDAARIYANWGPLNAELEARLAARLDAAVVTVSTATDGLACALRAALEDRPEAARRGYCLMPSWTFVATAHAALAAGLTPLFVDVDEASWALTPERAAAALPKAMALGAGQGVAVSAIMAVAPFGRPMDPAPWDALAAATGIPVVLDAAAGFDGLRVGRCPAVVSLHATKTVCAGEGGFVATTDPDLARRVKRAANFGFFGTRLAEVAGWNAKLSEYHAAVALASLDGWPARRAGMLAAASRLAALLAPLGCALPEGFGRDWVSSTLVARLPPGREAAELAVALGLRGVATRAWWGAGCHASPAFAACPRLPGEAALPVTARLARATLGLPFHPDMAAGDIARVGAALSAALRVPTRRRRGVA